MGGGHSPGSGPAYRRRDLSVAVAPSEKFDDSKIFSEGWLILRNVEFVYDSSEGYTSIISTDYCITIPELSGRTQTDIIARQEQGQRNV